jgi:hypothetical protein
VNEEQWRDIDWLVGWLGDPANARAAAAFPIEGAEARLTGVYAWHGDDVAKELVRTELNLTWDGPLFIRRTPSALNTCIVRDDMRNTKASTLRQSLAAMLWDQLDLRCLDRNTLDGASEARLTAWMGEHLSVVIVPVGDPVTAKLIAANAIDRHDPPFNLTHAARTPWRKRLRKLRQKHLSSSSEVVAWAEHIVALALAEKADPGVVIPITRASGRGSMRSRMISSRHPAGAGRERGA